MSTGEESDNIQLNMEAWMESGKWRLSLTGPHWVLTELFRHIEGNDNKLDFKSVSKIGRSVINIQFAFEKPEPLEPEISPIRMVNIRRIKGKVYSGDRTYMDNDVETVIGKGGVTYNVPRYWLQDVKPGEEVCIDISVVEKL